MWTQKKCWKLFSFFLSFFLYLLTYTSCQTHFITFHLVLHPIFLFSFPIWSRSRTWKLHTKYWKKLTRRNKSNQNGTKQCKRSMFKEFKVEKSKMSLTMKKWFFLDNKSIFGFDTFKMIITFLFCSRFFVTIFVWDSNFKIKCVLFKIWILWNFECNFFLASLFLLMQLDCYLIQATFELIYRKMYLSKHFWKRKLNESVLSQIFVLSQIGWLKLGRKYLIN